MLFDWMSRALQEESWLHSGKEKERGRPKLRWEDGVMDGARKLGENWRNDARNKDGWQKLLKKAWAQTGLLCP
jgi:hypothetical protein